MRAIRIWFFLAGVFGLFTVLFALELLSQTQRQSPSPMELTNTLVAGFLLMSSPLALVQFWMSIRLPVLLRDRPRIPIRVAWLGIILSVMRFDVFGVAIGYIIVQQLKRLAREADLAPEQRILE